MPSWVDYFYMFLAFVLVGFIRLVMCLKFWCCAPGNDRIRRDVEAGGGKESYSRGATGSDGPAPPRPSAVKSSAYGSSTAGGTRNGGDIAVAGTVLAISAAGTGSGCGGGGGGGAGGGAGCGCSSSGGFGGGCGSSGGGYGGC